MLEGATVMTYMSVAIDKSGRNIQTTSIANLGLLAPGMRRARSDVTNAPVENGNVQSFGNLPRVDVNQLAARNQQVGLDFPQGSSNQPL
jgi:hypothetical protein